MRQAPLRIRFGGYTPPDSIHTQAARFFKGAVEREAGGFAGVDVFHNVLEFGYGFGDLVELVRAGVLTCAYISTAYLAEAAPALGAFDLPFLFGDRAAAHAAMDGALGDLLAREAEARLGLTGLGYWENGFRHVTSCRAPVTSLADLVGLRIRVQPSAIHRRTFELLGAVPVPTDLKEWRDLPSEVQDLVRRAARDATLHQRRLAAAKDGEMAAVLQAEGVQIHQPDAAFLEACRRRVAPILQEGPKWVGSEAAAAVARFV